MGNPPDPARSARPWVASYPPGVPPTYHLPAVGLPRLLDDAARDFPEHLALEVGSRELTYTQLRDRVAELTGVLLHVPLSNAASRPETSDDVSLKGARVLVRVRDGVAGPIVLFALWRVGAVPVPVGPDLPDEHLTELLERQELVGAIGDPKLLRDPALEGLRFLLEVHGDEWDGGRLRRLANRLPTPRLPRRARGRTSATDADPADPSVDGTDRGDTDRSDTDRGDTGRSEPFTASVAELREASNGHASAARPSLDPEDPALVVVGSSPDGLALTTHTHRTLLASAFQSRLWVPDVQAGRERLLVAEPLHDLVGLTIGLVAGVLSGATAILLEEGQGLARAIERRKPSLLVARAQRVAELDEDGDASRRDLSSLRVVLAVGDGLGPAVAHELERRSAGARFRALHGCGDAVPVSHGQPVYGRVVATAWGLPVTSTLAVIVDPDDVGSPRAPDEPGRLLVHGPQIPPQTDDGPVQDGWLVTDLIAMVDEDGWFTPIGRIDHVVQVGGRSRSPVRIAEVLARHPKVRDVEVVELDGQLVAAALPTRRRHPPRAETLATALARHLDHRLLPDEIAVIEELPRDGSGFADHDELRDEIEAAQDRASLHTGDPVPPRSGTPPDASGASA